MLRTTRTLFAGIAAGAVAMTLAPAMASDREPAATKAPTRTLYLTAVEFKGTANVASESYPEAEPPAGGAYGISPPDVDGNWRAQAYRFDAATLVAYQGERVRLRIFGVNGDAHEISVPKAGKELVVRRGRLTTVRFPAKRLGTYRIVCTTHKPAMVTDLVVLPRALR